MSEFSAKTLREKRKEKAARMGSADPSKKVDSSDWTPPEPLNADVKTGARPISRRAFKSGGKVCGEKAKANMGRAPRKAGGVAAKDYANAKVNRNVKDANEEREGIKHVGGFKKGGRTNKRIGGALEFLSPALMVANAIRGDKDKDEKKRGGRTGKSNGGSKLPVDKDYADKVEAAGKGQSPDAQKQRDEMRHMLNSQNPPREQDYKHYMNMPNRKAGGRTKKNVGGPMMGMMPDPRLSMVSPTAMKFSGAQGTPYKRGGKVHSDEAEDKKLIKKMVKPEARTGRATGGKVKKGKTNINIIINAGKKDDGGVGMPPPPPGLPGGPMSLQRPMGGMPPGMPPMPPGMPAGGPPSMGQPPMPPMARKSGGRVSKVAKSYKDMEAGAGSGEGRLQKTDIAKRNPKPKEDGVILTKDRGYPNKVLGATGGRTAHKDGGKVYRSYKDMDAGAGSGKGRLEKEEIQKRKH